MALDAINFHIHYTGDLMRKFANKNLFFTSLFIVLMILTHGFSYASDTTTSSTTLKPQQSDKIYKSIGPNGEVIYSDKPSPGSKQITVPTNDGYQPVPVPSFTPYQAPSPSKQVIRNSITITNPADQQTIRNVHGEVNVSVSLGSGLRGGQQLEYVLDGKTVYTGTQTSHRFNNIFRGTHVLIVRITDNSASIESSPVTFYVHRPHK